MNIFKLIRKKIARRKQRKAIRECITITDGQIVINADVIVKGTITGK